MAINHIAGLSRGGNGNQTVSGAQQTGTNEPAVQVQLAASTTNQLVAVAFTVASLLSIWITVDQTTTLKTNSTSSPANTFTLSPLAPFFWQASSGISCPFSADVSAIYLTSGTTLTNVAMSLLKA